ncbi:MAG: hypothetical protein U1C73_03385 [Dietzia sp.]|nr:hypothetical protein [Dietzia sp.]
MSTNYATADYTVRYDQARRDNGVNCPAGYYVYGNHTGLKVGRIGVPMRDLDQAIRVCDSAQSEYDSRPQEARTATQPDREARLSGPTREAYRIGASHGVNGQIWDNA